MNYEQSKVQVRELKMDTIALRLAIKKLQGANADLHKIEQNFKWNILPAKDSMIYNLQKLNKLQKKQSRTNYFRGGSHGIILGIALTITGILIFK